MSSGTIHEMNEAGLLEFISTRDGLLQIIEQLRGGAKERLGYSTIFTYLSKLIEKTGSIYQSYTLPRNLTVHRARFIDSLEKKLNLDRCDLGPLSPEKTLRYGRCHQPHKPVCYCSLYEDIALSEIHAEKGHYYIISTFELQKDIRLVPVGELDYFRRTERTYIGGEDPKVVERYNGLIKNNLNAVVIDAFLAAEFLKFAVSNIDYIITSAYSDVLFNNLYPELPEVLIYPSVGFRGGLNFAISINAYESKMKLIESETKIVKIVDVLGYGIYEFESVAILKSCTNEILEWD